MPHLRSAGRPVASATFRLSLAALTLAAVLCAFPVKASAHYKYDLLCCSGEDCEPIASDRVKETPEGFTLSLGPDDHKKLKEAGLTERREWFVPRSEAKKPLDFDFHACFTAAGTLLCFYSRGDGA